MSDSSEGGDREASPFDAFASAMEQSWAAPFRMWSAFANTWQSALQNRGVPVMQAAMKQMMGAGGWNSGLAPLAEEMLDIFALPKLADIPTLEQGALPSLVPAAELMMVTQEYMISALTVGMRACQRFQAEIAERRQSGRDVVDSAGEAMDLWNNVLDQTLMEFNRSEKFAAAQQRFLRAAMRQRQEVRKLTESVAKAIDLPTRGEINDVYARLHDLLREVHGLRHELRALKRGTKEQKASTPVQEGRKK